MVSGYSTLVQFQSGTRNFVLLIQTLNLKLFLNLYLLVWKILAKRIDGILLCFVACLMYEYMDEFMNIFKCCI